MHPSLQAIAKKAREKKSYRFRNLYRLLNEGMLLEAWKRLNRRAACGVDRMTVEEYERNLVSNIRSLVQRLKQKRYKAKLVRRVYIPKGKDKLRPLGIPALEDKLVQTAAAEILSAIYEQDFLESSHGYRPHMGPRRAVQALTKELQFGNYTYVVEADIRGFFDEIDHEWMVRMLEQRVDDRAFVGLIRKWLKAGILMPEGTVEHPITGTPQGGIVSPVLANVYLHYAVDLWFEKVVKRRCEGEAYLCRYADDFVCAFRYKRDAEWFYGQLGERLGKFGLQLALEKSGIKRFSRFHKEDRSRFDFLGFEFRWGTDRKGTDRIRRRTSRAKLRKSLANLTQWCREHRNDRLRKLFDLLNMKLRGYYNYYGVIGNAKSLKQFFDQCVWILFKWLNRRSQRRSFTAHQFFQTVKRYGILRPRITEFHQPVLSFVHS
jgi:RNA-directed DNA polymerase